MIIQQHFQFQSAESKDLRKPNKSLKVKSNESLAETPRSSEDDFDSAFTENGMFTSCDKESLSQSNVHLLFPVHEYVLIQ